MQKDGKLADVPSEEVKKEVKNKGGEMETGVKEEIKQVDTKDNKEGVSWIEDHGHKDLGL